MIKLISVLLLTIGFVVNSSPLLAQKFPSQTVRIIVPFAPGGVSDILARVIAEKLTHEWKQPVIVENKAGAGGALGAEFVGKSPPDGYTLLIADASVVTANPFLYKNAPKDFSPVMNLARFAQILVTPQSSKLQTVGDLLSLNKADQARLNAASSGNGTSNHLVLEKFKTAARSQITHVPFKGAGQAITAVAGAQVDLMFTSPPLAQPLIDSGKIRALAITSLKRVEKFDSVPTLSESGFQGFEWYSVQGLFAPPNTPKEILEEINTTVAKVLQLPDVRQRWEKLGLEYVANSAEEFNQWARKEADATKQLIQSANITVE